MPCGVGGTHRSWPGGVGGGTHRSWPGGRGVDQGRVGLAERAPPTELAWWTGGQGGGARARGGCKGFGSGGVGGRGTGPRDGANFATCVVFLSRTKKEEKWLFLKDALWGGWGAHRSWPGGGGGGPGLGLAGKG